MDKPKRIRPPKCACSARKIDGRCSAIPSCDDFKRPSELDRGAAGRERAAAREAATIGINRAAVSQAAARLDLRQAVASEDARRRSLTGWRSGERRERRAVNE